MFPTFQGAYFVPTSAPPAGLLLDTYPGAGVAISVRKLRAAYSGPCLRVRRDSDNAELDINFVADYIDEAAILAFRPGGNCYVVRWYDQSLNANHPDQITAVNQPAILTTGALRKVNGKVSPYTGYLQLLSPISGVNNWSVFQVSKRAGAGAMDWCLAGSAQGVYSSTHYLDDVHYLKGPDPGYAISAADTSATQNVITSISNLTAQEQYKNGVIIPGTTPPTVAVDDFLYLGYFSYSTFSTNAYLQELIHWPADQSINRTAIELNMRTYYGF